MATKRAGRPRDSAGTELLLELAYTYFRLRAEGDRRARRVGQSTGRLGVLRSLADQGPRTVARAGRVVLCRANVSRLPFASGCFDRVCAVNSFQFWPAPEKDLQELRRVLKPGGLLALTLRQGTGSSAFALGHLAEPSRLPEALRTLGAAGFRDLRTEARRLHYVTAACVLARA